MELFPNIKFIVRKPLGEVYKKENTLIEKPILTEEQRSRIILSSENETIKCDLALFYLEWIWLSHGEVKALLSDCNDILKECGEIIACTGSTESTLWTKFCRYMREKFNGKSYGYHIKMSRIFKKTYRYILDINPETVRKYADKYEYIIKTNKHIPTPHYNSIHNSIVGINHNKTTLYIVLQKTNKV